MVLTGTVRNVIDFGAFVDIGVHQDGLVHISQICDRYIKHPTDVLSADMFKVWNGGLAIYGGIIGAIISTVIYCKVKKLNIAKVFDVCAPGLFIGQAIGRFGNFVNVEVYGGETNSLFGMSINGATPVHPLFLYESIWNVIGLVILLLIRDKKKNDGQVFCFYIFWYSFGRLFLEGMRNPNYILYVIPNVLGISQLVAILFMIAAVSAFVVLQVKAKKDNEI